jgi:hexosaminidase
MLKRLQLSASSRRDPYPTLPALVAAAARPIRPAAAMALVSVAVLGLSFCPLPAAPQPEDVMPAPVEVKLAPGRLAITDQFTVALRGADTPRLRAAIVRAFCRWEERTGLTFKRTAAGAFIIGDATSASNATVLIDCRAPAAAIPALGEDESYALLITDRQAQLQAATDLGVQRGLETLLQLLQPNPPGWYVPALMIHDRPRFPWRGLMIDVCRHWQPIEVIKRNIDGMAVVKLNVLHLHLTEDQGFRIESKRFPRLQELGSDGHFFTQDQMREIITYAADRGIRVVPEFDIPGHATSWVVGFPELASGPGPYVIERHWGVFDPVLDPTNEKTYELLDGFLGEMAALFPDPYLHIGGDENNGKQWNANPRIQAFIREHGLKSNEGLHAYFNRRVRDILQKHGKKLVGWDEILHPDLPKDSVIQSWRGAKGLAEAASRGFTAILSNGYYIDLNHHADEHYRNDPLPAGTKLTAAEQQRILGGEATMWSEWVTPEIIDSRIWPRTAAIAERLWSPREVDDVADMYRRLARVSQRLEEAGLQHDQNRPAMIRRYLGAGASDALLQSVTVFVDVVEPVKNYQRGQQQPEATQFTPLTGLPDCARPESDVARAFNDAVRAHVFAATPAATDQTGLRAQLVAWQRAADLIANDGAKASPRLAHDGRAVATALSDACKVALDALDRYDHRVVSPSEWSSAALNSLAADAQPHDALELPIIGATRLLVAAAALQRERATLAPDEWQRRVERLATPAKPPVTPDSDS